MLPQWASQVSSAAPSKIEAHYVDAHDDSSKQVYIPTDQYAEVVAPAQYQQQSYYSTQNDDSAAANPQPYATDRRKVQRPWLVPAIVAVIAAVIAGVIGGIIGWKVTESRASNGTIINTNGQPAAVCPATPGSTVNAENAIRKNSGLAAIGWRTKEDYNFQIFYQDPSDNLMTSWYSSLYANWTLPKRVVMDSGDKAMAGTPLAVSTIYVDTNVDGEYIPQNQLSYLSPTGEVQGYNFRLTWPLGRHDSILDKNYKASIGSSVTSLWPVQHYQDSNGTIVELNQIVTVNNLSAVPKPQKDTPMLALPGAAQQTARDLRLFYRNTDGQLAMFARGNSAVTGDTRALGVALPASATLAGFATGRDGSSLATNAYVLWQDPSRDAQSGGIQVLSQTDASGNWAGPVTDPVFTGADVPTHIACITEGVGVSDQPSQGSIVLNTNHDLNRCFFQFGGRLKQVWHNGKIWVDMGFVLMP